MVYSQVMKYDIKSKITEFSDAKNRELQLKLIPGASNVHGVRSPDMRKLATEIAKNYPDNPLDQLTDDSYEEIILQGMLIAKIKDNFDTIKPYVENYIPKIDNWAACDTFCAAIKNMGKYKTETWEFILPYFESDKEYQARFAIIMALSHFAGEEKYTEEIFSAISRVKHDGYYVKMASAWLVSVCFVKFPDKTMQFLQNNNLDDFTYNKALQKILESFRVTDETKQTIRGMKRKTK